MIGFEEEVTQDPEEQEAELHHLELNLGGAVGTEGSIVELPECPSHYPTSFIKGKPRSISHFPIIKITDILSIDYMLALSLGIYYYSYR